MQNARFKRFFELQPPQVWLLAAALLWCPGLGGELKQSMLTHMGMQLSLLVWTGWCLGRSLLHQHPGLHQLARAHRWSWLLLAAFTLMTWMLPRLLDAAFENPVADAIKTISLVLGAGLPLSWCWPHLPAVARGVLHVEALATVWRLGWLYLDSPTRLCTRYGLDDQQRLGQYLMAVGALYALWLAVMALREQPLPSSMNAALSGHQG